MEWLTRSSPIHHEESSGQITSHTTSLRTLVRALFVVKKGYNVKMLLFRGIKISLHKCVLILLHTPENARRVWQGFALCSACSIQHSSTSGLCLEVKTSRRNCPEHLRSARECQEHSSQRPEASHSVSTSRGRDVLAYALHNLGRGSALRGCPARPSGSG